jgi:amidase
LGTIVNAYDTSKFAVRSSGGTAVALVLKLVSVADGRDMMGSLRNTSAYNNFIGFRPSIGLVPYEPNRY